MRKSTFIFALFFLTLFAYFSPALAADSGAPMGSQNDSGGSWNGGSPTTLINPLNGVDCSKGNGDCLNSFLLNILNLVIRIGSIVVVLMLVYTGYKFVVARGNASELEEARRMLLWTIIGALILLGAQAIALGINATVNALKVGS